MSALILLPINGPSYSNTILADNPSGYWPLQETSGVTAVDLTGTDNGTYTGTYTQGAPGPFGSEVSLQLAGAGYVTIPNANFAWIGSPSQDYTFECWAAVPVVAGPEALIDKTSGGNWNVLFGRASRIEVQLWAGGGGGGGPANPIVYDTSWPAWTHIAYVRKAGVQIELYVDGVPASPVPTDTDSSNINASNSNPINIGAGQNGSTWFWTGSIAHVGIYNYALSAAQVAAHKAAGV